MVVAAARLGDSLASHVLASHEPGDNLGFGVRVVSVLGIRFPDVHVWVDGLVGSGPLARDVVDIWAGAPLLPVVIVGTSARDNKERKEYNIINYVKSHRIVEFYRFFCVNVNILTYQ